ncbi:hypothetical protein [Ruania rhizosphaerae]|uniref:hypothetical protein n=1 Tax=Ruania rhizosphaerae TaxID=1840413 RepID=UPI00135C4DA9|nr:hypothetical protein [Ruania rhizosphaerae]
MLRQVEVRLIADTTAFTGAMRRLQEAVSVAGQDLQDWLDESTAQYAAVHARPGDTRTRALRRTETTRRSSMHAAYRAKTRRRNRR